MLVPPQALVLTLQQAVDLVGKHLPVVPVVPVAAAVVPPPQVPVIHPHLLLPKETMVELVHAVTMKTTGLAVAVAVQEASVEVQRVHLQSVELEITQPPELLLAVQVEMELQIT
jgi:hypothetical protein